MFKCLTDNILLDDFKSVLQRLGNMSLDETSATFRQSMNVNPTEKSQSTDHREDVYGEASTGVTLNRTPDSISTPVDFEDALNDPELGRQHSTTANAIGKLGIKIQRLPKLPS